MSETWKQYQVDCVHFNGVVNKTCAAGVAYDSVKDPTAIPGRGWKLPCFTTENAATVCSLRQLRTEEEARAYDADIQATIASYFEDIAARRCPHCQQSVQRQRQVGRCVYAEPCGHRLYQGLARNP